MAAPSLASGRPMVLASVFGCITLAAALWLAFRSASVSGSQFEILRIVLALAGGSVGAIVPGFLDLHLKVGAKLALRPGGALAVFVVLYFWSPAQSPTHWKTIQQSTEGNSSPNIIISPLPGNPKTPLTGPTPRR